jgi:hypothetical protein
MNLKLRDIKLFTILGTWHEDVQAFSVNIAEYVSEFKIFERSCVEKEYVLYAQCTYSVNLTFFEMFKENSSRYLKTWIVVLSSQTLDATRLVLWNFFTDDCHGVLHCVVCYKFIYISVELNFLRTHSLSVLPPVDSDSINHWIFLTGPCIWIRRIMRLHLPGIMQHNTNMHHTRARAYTHTHTHTHTHNAMVRFQPRSKLWTSSGPYMT